MLKNRAYFFILPICILASTISKAAVGLYPTLSSSIESLAATGEVQPNTDQLPNEYFTFTANNLGGRRRANFTAPSELLRESMVAGVIAAVPLTSWVLHTQPPQAPTEKYDRKGQFGTWINDPNDNTCYNTRAKVLMRDSSVQVSYKPNNHCVVDGGRWFDPYTGQTFTSTKDIQIDHVVPLKHAYITGAFRWDYKTRCHYANFLNDSYHLLAVNGHQNMSKGDKSPDAYVPPNTAAICGYVQRWLQIKIAWGLVIFPAEARAVRQLISYYRCNPNLYYMDENEIATIRRSISNYPASCIR